MEQGTLDALGDTAASSPRSAERFRFIGSTVHVFAHWRELNLSNPTERYLLRLRDLSQTGLSGLTDAPLRVGDVVFIQLDEKHIPAAKVVWFRRVLIGLEFIEPLQIGWLTNAHRRHAAGQAWSPAMRLNCGNT
jgi:hypothetical protein